MVTPTPTSYREFTYADLLEKLKLLSPCQLKRLVEIQDPDGSHMLEGTDLVIDTTGFPDGLDHSEVMITTDWF